MLHFSKSVLQNEETEILDGLRVGWFPETWQASFSWITTLISDKSFTTVQFCISMIFLNNFYTFIQQRI